MMVNPAVNIRLRVAAHPSSDSRPTIRAAPALAMRVRLFEPRNWNWKSRQSSWKIAPSHLKTWANVNFQPNSTFLK